MLEDALSIQSSRYAALRSSDISQSNQVKSVGRVSIEIVFSQKMRLLPATKSTFGKALKHRVTMLKNLVTHVIMREQIVTTPAKAAAVRPLIEMVRSGASIRDA
jgi:hypothetical protein